MAIVIVIRIGIGIAIISAAYYSFETNIRNQKEIKNQNEIRNPSCCAMLTNKVKKNFKYFH